MNIMLDFICMGQVDLLGVRRKWEHTIWKIIALSVIWTHSDEIASPMLYRLAFENDVEERILSCKCTISKYLLYFGICV